MRSSRLISALTGAALLVSLAGCTAGTNSEAPGSGNIVVGALLPLSGAAANYGPVYQGGIEAYIGYINDQGGVNGRQIDLKIYDNGYDPAKSLAAARTAVEQDDVVAFVSTPGTPVNDAISAYLEQEGIPNMFIITGAAQYNEPAVKPLTFQFQLSYADEPVLLADFIKESYPNSKVGVLYQNDDFGQGLKDVFQEAAGSRIVALQPYESTDTSVTSQIAALKEAGADLVVSFVLAKFAILAAQAKFNTGWDAPMIISANANDPAVLSAAGNQVLEGIIGGLSFPDPVDDAASVAEYRELMAKYSPSTPLGASSMQTFAATKLFIKTLEKAGTDYSGKSIAKAAETLTEVTDLPLIGQVSLSPRNHNAVQCAAMTQYQSDGTLKAISDPICIK